MTVPAPSEQLRDQLQKWQTKLASLDAAGDVAAAETVREHIRRIKFALGERELEPASADRLREQLKTWSQRRAELVAKSRQSKGGEARSDVMGQVVMIDRHLSRLRTLLGGR